MRLKTFNKDTIGNSAASVWLKGCVLSFRRSRSAEKRWSRRLIIPSYEFSIVLDAKHLFPCSISPIYLFTKVHQFLSRILHQRLAPITAGP